MDLVDVFLFVRTRLFLLAFLTVQGFHFINLIRTEPGGHMLNINKTTVHRNCLSGVNYLSRKLLKNSSLLNMAEGKECFETLRERCKNIIPDLTDYKHKGQSGRIGVFGGCKDYTGAPYFASMSALRTGADLVYVFCAEAAAQPIKSYSPELMVVPYLDVDMPALEIQSWIRRLHVAVIGPGLGRNTNILHKIGETIGYIKSVNIPLVIDADGLFFLSQNPEILNDYKGAIYITPNINELKLLSSAILHSTQADVDDASLSELSKRIGKNVTILLKGKDDKIVQGDKFFVYPVEGSPRRCGGQGDILSGCLATIAGWAEQCEDNRVEAQMCAALAASTMVKTCSKITFKGKGRGMIASDMLAKVHLAFDLIFDEHKYVILH